VVRIDSARLRENLAGECRCPVSDQELVGWLEGIGLARVDSAWVGQWPSVNLLHPSEILSMAHFPGGAERQIDR